MGDGNSARVTNGDVHVQSVTYVNSEVKLGLSSSSSSSSYLHHMYQQPSSGGVMGKVVFTGTQWEELERQKKIYMYIMASLPVPPHLLSPLSLQSNRMSTGLRFANGSDPEPWRCRRTDGKKWRCSKDVVPDQKYCERHVHKSRSRSRKPVENQSQNVMISAANQQTKFMKNGSIPVSQPNNQYQLPLQSSSAGSRNDHIPKQDLKRINQQSSYLDRDNHYLNTSATDWSRINGGDECSLTLSMQSGANEVEFDDESFQMAVGMLRGDKDVFKPRNQWVNNQTSWAGSGVTPGGPLGEALCLGIASNQNESYFHNDYSYSTTTSSS